MRDFGRGMRGRGMREGLAKGRRVADGGAAGGFGQRNARRGGMREEMTMLVERRDVATAGRGFGRGAGMGRGFGYGRRAGLCRYREADAQS